MQADVRRCEHCGYTGRQFLEMEQETVPDTPKDVDELPPRSQIPRNKKVGDAGWMDRVFVSALLTGIAAFLVYLLITVINQHVI